MTPHAVAGVDPRSATASGIAAEFDQWMRRLFPIARSITGPGNRETLRQLQALVPLTIQEVPTGTAVHDWVIPDEWTIRDAWIATADGRKIVDFAATNLHVVSYSEPVRATMSWQELAPHLHVHPVLADAVPYRTSYYRRTWGFCVTHAERQALEHHGGPFEVVIDADLGPGSLSYGEYLLPGRSPQEILISSYICHPSMANDSLSGVVMAAFLARQLAARPDRQWSYRFAFVPETIGAVAYCALNDKAMRNIDVALVVTTVGGPGACGYKQSWQPGHAINRIIEDAFREAGEPFVTYPFDIHGSDERQYSSQAYRINAATICRDRYYEYAEYHTSKDDLRFVTGAQMARTYDIYCRVLNALESRRLLRSRVPAGEVMLSRHGLYPAGGGALLPEAGGRTDLDLMLWLLFWCDGRTSVQDIARQLQVPEATLQPIAARLLERGLLEHV